jgi:hypothetical protein
VDTLGKEGGVRVTFGYAVELYLGIRLLLCIAVDFYTIEDGEHVYTRAKALDATS